MQYIFCSKVRLFVCQVCNTYTDNIQETKQKTSNSKIHYYTRSRIASLVTLLMTILVLLLLVFPVWLFYQLSLTSEITNNPETLAFLVLFTMLFSFAVITFTKARRHEVLVASAG